MSDKQNKGGGARKIGRNKNSRYTSEHRFERNKTRRAKTHARRVERKLVRKMARLNKEFVKEDPDKLAMRADKLRKSDKDYRPAAQVLMDHFTRGLRSQIA